MLASNAIGHYMSDKAEAAYKRGDQFEKRRKLMEVWSTFCDASLKNRVVQLHRNNK